MTKGQNNDQNETYSGLEVNRVKVLEDADFEHVRNLCENHAGWHCAYDKKSIKVWTKQMSKSSFHMIKARSLMDDVPASTAYDVLHDTMYRSVWDKYMLSTIDIGPINPNNDICYYAVGAMPPFRSRDFVMQRSWIDFGNEKFICSHSVCHEKYPPMKGYIRGTVFLTAYLIREVGNGCQITFVTHSDPKGKLPAWLTNRLTKVVGPRVIKKLHKACINYPKWKSQNQPHYKPWLYPEQQINLERINLSDCRPQNYEEEVVDECYGPEVVDADETGTDLTELKDEDEREI